MKKETLRRHLTETRDQLVVALAAADHWKDEAAARDQQVRALTAEVEQMRQHWRPVPITHEWQSVNPRCALCDEPRDAARHRTEG